MDPTCPQMEMLGSFDGNREKLGAAEKFCVSLTALPSYKARIDAMLLRADFPSNADSVQGKTDAIDTACEGIISSQSLKLFLKAVLQTGNFINSVRRLRHYIYIVYVNLHLCRQHGRRHIGARGKLALENANMFYNQWRSHGGGAGG